MEVGDSRVVAVGVFVLLSVARSVALLKLLFSLANFSQKIAFSPNGSVSNGELSLEGTKLAFVGCTFNVLKMS